MATYELDKESLRYCVKLIKRYKKRFGHINPSDIVVVRDITSPKSRAYATTSLIPHSFRPLLPYKIIIRTWECNYAKLSKNARILVMDHELRHLVLGNNGEYGLVQHDVQDFQSMLEEYGLAWTRRKDLPNLLSST